MFRGRYCTVSDSGSGIRTPEFAACVIKWPQSVAWPGKADRAEKAYQQKARHEYYWHTDHVYCNVYGIAMVGAIEDQMLLQVKRHGGGFVGEMPMAQLSALRQREVEPKVC